MKYTLLFNAMSMPIQWHDEAHNGNLFNKPAGTIDPNGTGWVSTGITFESGNENWTYWICHIVNVALEGKKKTTIAEVLKLIDYLVAFHKGEDLCQFEQKYEENNE